MPAKDELVTEDLARAPDGQFFKLSEEMARINYVDACMRTRSVTLLMVGSICGFLGFLNASFLGYSKYFAPVETNYLGQPFSSGHNYFPQTVSEMVYDKNDASGKCFFAFCMIGAICIFLSWYPWQLRNVYLGDDAKIWKFAWANLRVYLPPVGMMLVACIPTTPAANATARDKVTVIIHTLGAVMMIGGYAIFELYTLYLSPQMDRNIKKNERFWRTVHLVGTVVGIVGFQLFGLLATHADALGVCCNDEWVSPTVHEIKKLYAEGNYGKAFENADAMGLKHKVLKNTASGSMLFIKQAEYWFEVASGLFMIASHLTIWWYCPERRLDVAEQLPGLWTQGDEEYKENTWHSLYEKFDEEYPENAW